MNTSEEFLWTASVYERCGSSRQFTMIEHVTVPDSEDERASVRSLFLYSGFRTGGSPDESWSCLPASVKQGRSSGADVVWQERGRLLACCRYRGR
jgi:hypothetical protein